MTYDLHKPKVGDTVCFVDDRCCIHVATVTGGVDSLSGQIERWDGTVSLSYERGDRREFVSRVEHVAPESQSKPRTWFWGTE